MPQGNQQMMDSAPDESPFQQVIPSILQQSLYPSLAALETSVNTAVSPPIPFSRRVINDIEEQQRKALEDTVEGTIRSTNTSPTSDLDEQDEEVIIPSIKPQAGITQTDAQEETLQPESLEAEDGIRDSVASRGLGDVYKRQVEKEIHLVHYPSFADYLVAHKWVCL